MASYIKKIKKNNDSIFPQTVAEAVLFQGGETLDEKIETIEDAIEHGGGGTGTVTGAKVGASGELIEPTEGVIVLPEYPTVSTNVSDLTNDAGYTTNTGTVTGIQVGSGSTISPTDGVVTIPAYPTTLPASDVSEWAKAANKPSYSYSEISGTPSLGTAAAKDVPSTGNASTTEVVMGNDSRLSDARTPLSHTHTPSEVGLGNVTNDTQVKRTEMGAASGVATLGTDGKVPSSQLPSYVDDVLEYAGQSSFPSTGESGKIYVALDTNKTYRWSGTAYVEISPSVVIGTTTGTAYDGASGAALASKLSGIEAGAQVHKAPTETEVKTALGATGSGTTKYLREDGTWATPPDNNTWTAASTSAAGYVPAATKGKFLHSNASTGALEWIDDNNTTYTLAGLMGSSAKGSTTQPVYWDGSAWQNTSYTLGKSVPSNAVFTDTTYESKAAASGGTAVSLVTTGEKYTWNNKSTLAIGSTSTTAAAGNHTHTTSIATSTGTNQITLAANTKYAITAGGTSYVFTTPPDTNTTYSVATTSANGLMSSTDKSKLDGIASGATANTGTITKVGNTSSGAVTVSSSNNSASWGSAVTVGSVGGVDLKFTMPSNPNTNTTNTAGATDTSSKIYLIGATSQAASPQTYSDNEVYVANGVLTTKSVQVGGTAATIQYNSTLQAIEFVFA